MDRGDEVVLHIDEAVSEGKTIARLDNFVVFVEGAVPGDEIRAFIYKKKKSFAEARVVEVMTPSPLRVTPRCRYFGVCGGCRWQHLDYAKQCEFKRKNVVDALERIGGFRGIDVRPVLGSEQIYNYRNKMEFSFGTQRWLTSGEMQQKEAVRSDFALGFHIPQRYDKVLDIEECHLQSQLTVDILNAIRAYSLAHRLPVYSPEDDSGYLRFLVIREAKRTGELMVNLVTGKDQPATVMEMAEDLHRQFPAITTFVNTINEKKAQIAFGETQKVCLGSGFIREKLGKLTFTISANSFFQTNTLQAERLYALVKEFAGCAASDTVYDLYSGTGSIALFLSDAASRIVGIENVESAIGDARSNARENGITNCEFVLGDLKDSLTKDTTWMHSHPAPDILVIDPPRSGMHPKVTREVVTLGARRIVYVSCNPATQARDLKTMVEGGYSIEAVQPVDMFPHTFHIENVVRLDKE